MRGGEVEGDWMTVTEKTKIADLLKWKRGAEEVLRRFGIEHCSRCSAMEIETVEEGAISHGCDLRELLDALNKLDDA